MEHAHHEHTQLRDEIRRLRKLTHALRTAHDLRKQGGGAAENAANCIESLVREVERLTAQGH